MQWIYTNFWLGSVFIIGFKLFIINLEQETWCKTQPLQILVDQDDMIHEYMLIYSRVLRICFNNRSKLNCFGIIFFKIFIYCGGTALNLWYKWFKFLCFNSFIHLFYEYWFMNIVKMDILLFIWCMTWNHLWEIKPFE